MSGNGLDEMRDSLTQSDRRKANGWTIFVVIVSFALSVGEVWIETGEATEAEYVEALWIALLPSLLAVVINLLWRFDIRFDSVVGSIFGASERILNTKDEILNTRSDLVETKEDIIGISSQIQGLVNYLDSVDEIERIFENNRKSRKIKDIYVNGLNDYSNTWARTLTNTEGEYEVHCWARLFKVYLEEEQRSLASPRRSVSASLDLYWNILGKLAEEVKNIKKDSEVLCLWAVTNVLPKNWYNWEYPSGDEKADDFLDEYRSTIQKIIDDEIEMRRWILTLRNSDVLEGENELEGKFEIREHNDFRHHIDKYVKLDSNGEPVKRNTGEGKSVYRMADGDRGQNWEKLGNIYAEKLHSKPIDTNALVFEVDDTNYRILNLLPDDSPDFLAIGTRDEEEEWEGEPDPSDINWIGALSAELKPSHNTCMMHFVTSLNEEGYDLSELFAKLDDHADPVTHD